MDGGEEESSIAHGGGDVERNANAKAICGNNHSDSSNDDFDISENERTLSFCNLQVLQGERSHGMSSDNDSRFGSRDGNDKWSFPGNKMEVEARDTGRGGYARCSACIKDQ